MSKVLPPTVEYRPRTGLPEAPGWYYAKHLSETEIRPVYWKYSLKYEKGAVLALLLYDPGLAEYRSARYYEFYGSVTEIRELGHG